MAVFSSGVRQDISSTAVRDRREGIGYAEQSAAASRATTGRPSFPWKPSKPPRCPMRPLQAVVACPCAWPRAWPRALPRRWKQTL